MKANLNDYVLVRLTPSGEAQWHYYWTLSHPRGVPSVIRHAQTEADGRVRFQIHEMMNIFGNYTFNGSNQLPFVNNEVEFRNS